MSKGTELKVKHVLEIICISVWTWFDFVSQEERWMQDRQVAGLKEMGETDHEGERAELPPGCLRKQRGFQQTVEQPLSGLSSMCSNKRFTPCRCL